VVDDRTGNPDDIFSGGVKQDKNCPATGEGSLGGGNSKFDLDRLYLTAGESGGDDYLFLAWVRVPQSSTTASAHIAYEFNSGEDTCTSAADSLISRTAGDKLLVYDFEGGTNTSTTPNLKLLTWLTGSGSGCEVATARPCWGDVVSLNGTFSNAKVNTTDVGPVVDEIADPDQTLGVVQFGEAGINLSEIPDLDVCAFSGHVTGVARSSGNSGTAAMKDKVGPEVFELPGCVAETNITSQISLDDHATINGFDSQGPGDHVGDLTFDLYGPADTDCTGTPVYSTTIEDVDNGGPWSTADGDNAASSFIAEDEGTYNWVVTYTGDSANLPSASECGDESADVQYGF
jgi:hypothetical protein